jgi:hypothetical protein
MPLITRETGTYSKGSTLTFAEMDNNLIYLQGLTRLDLIPLADNTYTLGTSASRWKSISVGTLTFGDGTTQSTAAGIIQQYTPISATDSYGVTGSLVRDDENIYVRTNGYGWRAIAFDESYGSFYDTTNQLNPTASIARAININSTATASGVSIVSSNRISVDHDGIYNIQFSLQLIKTTANNGDADIWLRYNGVDVPNSNTVVTITDGSKGSNKNVAAWNFVQAMTASSYCQIYWSAADTGLYIYAIGTQSTPVRPATPSIIVTVDKISSLTRI